MTRWVGAHPGTGRESPWGESREARSQTGSEAAAGLVPPAATTAHQKQGFAYALSENYARVIDKHWRAAKHSPIHTAAFHDRGLAYHLPTDYGRAVEDRDRVIALNPEHTDTYDNRESIYSDKGTHQQAVEDFLRAIALAADYAAVYRNRGEAHVCWRNNTRGC